jgi:bifunctional non-homologous end joining protein LigD
VWAANLAALELHVPMAPAGALDQPSMVVFDLDPGAPAGIAECARVALQIRELLDGLGLQAWPKTSGSKGLQLYVPLNTPHSHDHASSFALAVAQVLERRDPGGVVSTMAREARIGKVFVDWSQNSFHKTTVGVYSLRARPRPTVSTPLTWEEVGAGAGGRALSFEAPEVLDRIEVFGDLFEPTLGRVQRLPEPRSRP